MSRDLSRRSLLKGAPPALAAVGGCVKPNDTRFVGPNRPRPVIKETSHGEAITGNESRTFRVFALIGNNGQKGVVRMTATAFNRDVQVAEGWQEKIVAEDQALQFGVQMATAQRVTRYEVIAKAAPLNTETTDGTDTTATQVKTEEN